MAARIDELTDTLSATTSIPTDNTCSACAWVRLDVDLNTFSSLWSLFTGTSHTINLCTDADGVSLRAWSQDGSASTGARVMTVGSWHRVGVITNGANTTLLVGNSDPAVALAQTGPSALTIAASPNTLRIGSDAFDEWANCSIAGFKLWGDVLTPTEIFTEFTQFDAVRTTGLLRAHRLESDLSASNGVSALTPGSTSVTYVSGPSGIPNTSSTYNPPTDIPPNIPVSPASVAMPLIASKGVY